MRAGAKGPSFAPPQRSLLGEILDWMLAPLFLLWPMSVAITYVVARTSPTCLTTARLPTICTC